MFKSPFSRLSFSTATPEDTARCLSTALKKRLTYLFSLVLFSPRCLPSRCVFSPSFFSSVDVSFLLSRCDFLLNRCTFSPSFFCPQVFAQYQQLLAEHQPDLVVKGDNYPPPGFRWNLHGVCIQLETNVKMYLFFVTPCFDQVTACPPHRSIENGSASDARHLLRPVGLYWSWGDLPCHHAP